MIFRGSFLPGGNESPTPNEGFSLVSCDVLTRKMLLWVEFVLEKYCGEFFRAVIERNESLNLPNNPDGYIVGSILPYSPDSIVLSEQLAFPLLAVYPTTTDVENDVIAQQVFIKRYVVCWILPSLSTEDFAKLNPFRQAVSDAILTRFAVGQDEDWNGGRHWSDGGDGRVCDAVIIEGATVNGMWDYSLQQGSNAQQFPIVVAVISVKQTPEAILSDFDELQEILFSAKIVDGYNSENQYLPETTIVESLTDVDE